MSKTEYSSSGVPKRFRNFCCVYYQEESTQVVQNLKDLYKMGTLRNYYLIQHEPESDDKQVHYHCVFEFWDGKSLRTAHKYLELRDGKVQACSDFRKQLRYLIHKDDKYKKQYTPFDVESTDMERYLSIINTRNDNEAQEFTLNLKKCFSLIKINSSMPWYKVAEILVSKYDLDAKFVFKTVYRVLYDFWQSCNTDYRGYEARYNYENLK